MIQLEDILAPKQAKALPPRVVWKAQPGSQRMAVSCPCNHILYEGARGPGKTDTQLMFFRKYVNRGYNRFWRGIVFDKEYKNLDDIVSKSNRWFPQMSGGGRWLSAGKDYKWVWPRGEELLFRSVSREEDYWDYHGQEFAFIGWNELCKYANAKLYDLMMSCNRTSFIPEEHTPKDKNGKYETPDGKPLPEIPLVTFSTANPYGPGHTWVKMRFVDKAPPGKIVKTTTNVFNPRTQEREDVVRTQVRIFGSYKENRFLSPQYVAFLENIKEPNRRKAWLEGDWNIVAGGAIDDVWDERCHVIPRFPIPAAWRVNRALDWGSSKPFSVGWYAETDGGEVKLPNGKLWRPRKGSVIRIHEFYGTKELGSNEGLVMSARTLAEKILEIERDLKKFGWIAQTPFAGPADNSINDKLEVDSPSIAELMAEVGVHWTESDKSPGSRKIRLQVLRDYLEFALRLWKGEDVDAWMKLAREARPKAVIKPRGCGYYIFEHCAATRALLPVLPRDPEDPDDVDTEAEDHIYDETGYRLTSKAGYALATDLAIKQH